ncbi:hypothetical protein DCAR_0625821 [Daucus carota subsp. sativus]|uniref:Uncharacterized protein n=1 Tax=Daucus carota subsp. sativus TaxID=79200 RepID=A0A164WQ45_DAUCS|nr:hypothetical protein DCAR_0625821 [Daucus carota subsp. sativus]
MGRCTLAPQIMKKCCPWWPADQVIDMANIGKRAIHYLHKLSAANIPTDLTEKGQNFERNQNLRTADDLLLSENSSKDKLETCRSAATIAPPQIEKCLCTAMQKIMELDALKFKGDSRYTRSYNMSRWSQSSCVGDNFR